MKKRLDRSNIIVKKENGTKKGYGFSKSELKLAKITIKKAFNKKLPVDKRRKSCHEENVKFLTNFTK